MSLAVMHIRTRGCNIHTRLNILLRLMLSRRRTMAQASNPFSALLFAHFMSVLSAIITLILYACGTCSNVSLLAMQ
jgi:hypothetical protein